MRRQNEKPEKILEVLFYQSENGKEPVREWLNEFPKVIKKTIGEDIKTVQHGWPLGMPLVRPMGDKIYEIRSTIPNGIARILFVVHDLAMILLHGFIKKTEKTPEKELEIASTRAKNF
jgi:phage-related protein